jgi:hypothetical protein
MSNSFPTNYTGEVLNKAGTIMLGVVVSVKTKGAPGYYQVRLFAIHGYCDINEENCEEDVVKKASLPWIATTQSDRANTAIRSNDVKQLTKGQFVLVRFDGDNYTSPLIISTTKLQHPALGSKEKFNQAKPYIVSALVKKAENGEITASRAEGACKAIITDATNIQDNGTSTKSASKCGTGGGLSDNIGAVIGDFMKIIQDTDGKIGSKFVNGITGELFSITGYVQKYLASITSIIRNGIGWIKAIITKEVRKAIDKLVKAIMVPIKGITSTINETLEKVLNMIFCSFGDIESMISNMIEGLLNTLIDSALNSIFGCLNTLVDGVMNEIMGEILGLMSNIIGVFESLAGIIGGFGDMFGMAINAILELLGISCGGSGSCSTAASNALVTAFNSPGEFGLTNGIKSSLNNGLSALDGVSGSIGKETSKLNSEAAEFAKGVDLGTANVPGVSTTNQALKNAFTTANNLAASKVANVFDFCNNLSNGYDGSTGSPTTPTNPDITDDGTANPVPTDTITPSTTTAVVVGSVDNKYDAVYKITPIGTKVSTGSTQKVKIFRNNSVENGVIIFTVHLKSTDTARVVGITPGVVSGGDLTLGGSLEENQYATNPSGMSSPEFPMSGNVITSKKVYFPENVKEVIVDIPTLKNNSPESGSTELTYTATIYRAVDDLDLNQYPYKNLPTTSSILHSSSLSIGFVQDPVADPTPEPIITPPQVVFKDITYSVSEISVTAGQPAQFKIIRAPLLAEETIIKCATSDGTAINNVNYEGGLAEIKFKAGESTKIFSVTTIENAALVNQSLYFNVTFTDLQLPPGSSSNLGGTGSTNGTSIGAGIVKKATINYTPVQTPSPVCPAEILITEPPVTCLVQEVNFPLELGFIAKSSVPGYVLSYEWQRTYDPSATWTTVTDGTRNELIDELVTTFGPSDVTFVDGSGNTVTLDGWETENVTQSASIAYTGATTSELSVAVPSYLINDEEYYRCIITATPTTPSIFTPTLTKTTENIYIGMTKTGVYLSSVNCAPPGTLADGDPITYDSAPKPLTPVLSDAAQCEVITPNPVTIPDVIIDDLVDDPADDVDPPSDPTNPTTPFIVPTIDVEPPIPVTPVVIDPGGGVVSVPIPGNLPNYKYPPLIPISGLGVGAVAKGDIDENGKLINIIIKSKGFGYPPSSFDQCGIITSIEVTNAGGFYESSPTVYVNDDPTIAVAAIDENGRLAEIRITNPQSIVYDRIPSIFIQGGDGVGGSAIAVIQYVPCDQVANRYLNVVNKYNESTLGIVNVVDCP